VKDIAPYIYPLLIAAFVVINYVVQRLAKGRKRQLPPGDAPTPAASEELRRAEELQRKRDQRRLRLQLKRQLQKQTADLPRATERVKRVPAVRDVPLEVLQARARANRPQLPDAPAIAKRRPAVKALLADRRSLRQAIVIMAVLGPCRAQQPHEVG
jgi:hypothetical protein